MNNRPELKKQMKSEEFKNYYYLKEELVEFCRENQLPATGGKKELTERIAYFLETGKVKIQHRLSKTKVILESITEETCIETPFTCSEVHRTFFKEKIGKEFSFNVQFQQWLKNNSGKTYKEAIEAYYDIKEYKKTHKSTIDKQFEYNTYIRDFFKDNKGKSLEDAIKCWKYKKSLPGHNRYEQEDLKVL